MPFPFFQQAIAPPRFLSLLADNSHKSSNPIFKINLVGVGFVFVVSLAAYNVYPGRPVAFFVFSAASLAVAALPLLGRLSVFTLFLAAFLTLGFWLKLISFLLFGLEFIEPIGPFDYSSEAWDRTLLISASGLAAVALAWTVCKVVDPQNEILPVDLGRSPRFEKIVWPLFLLSIAVAISIFFINYRYSVLQAGVVPLAYFGMIPNVSIAFTVSWGAMMWLGGLTFWMILARRLPASALFYVAAVEGAIASVSMASRVQMIVHVAAAFGAYWTSAGRFGWRISKKNWLLIAVTTALLFITSIGIVSVGRVTAYADVSPLARTANGSSIPSAATARPKGIAMLKRVVAEINTLFIGRWIGLEGAMVVSSVNGLDWNLLLAGLRERGEAGVDSIYQRMADATYPHYSDFIFETLPGPVAVIFYSGNFIILATGMGVIFIVCYTLERLAEHLSRNPVMTSVVGVALAYLFVQMNYPRTFFIFVFEIVATLVTMLLIVSAGSGPKATHQKFDQLA
jgi:hypothetical protein